MHSQFTLPITYLPYLVLQQPAQNFYLSTLFMTPSSTVTVLYDIESKSNQITANLQASYNMGARGERLCTKLLKLQKGRISKYQGISNNLKELFIMTDAVNRNLPELYYSPFMENLLLNEYYNDIRQEADYRMKNVTSAVKLFTNIYEKGKHY